MRVPHPADRKTPRSRIGCKLLYLIAFHALQSLFRNRDRPCPVLLTPRTTARDQLNHEPDRLPPEGSDQPGAPDRH